MNVPDVEASKKQTTKYTNKEYCTLFVMDKFTNWKILCSFRKLYFYKNCVRNITMHISTLKKYLQKTIRKLSLKNIVKIITQYFSCVMF